MAEGCGAFIVEMTTREGRISERYETLALAQRRVAQFQTENLLGVAYIFQELVDGSERAVREDGKPLQLHRVLAEETTDRAGQPLPLCENVAEVVGPDAEIRPSEPPPANDVWDEPPLPLA